MSLGHTAESVSKHLRLHTECGSDQANRSSVILLFGFEATFEYDVTCFVVVAFC